MRNFTENCVEWLKIQTTPFLLPKCLYIIFLVREIYSPHEKKFFLSRGKNISFVELLLVFYQKR